MSRFDARKLTWAALLGRWVQFARSAVALPDDAEGRKWRSAIPDLIGLQAVTCALGEIDQLPADQHALALDRAAILIERHSSHLHDRFGEDLHPQIGQMIVEAQTALRSATPTRD